MSKLPRYAGLSDEELESELGLNPRPAELARLLGTLWPDVSHALDGTWTMPAEQAQQLDEMFELFGVTVRTDNAPMQAIERAYGMCVLGFAHFVNMKLRQPEYFAKRTAHWAPAWLRYIDAVATGNRPEAKSLAARLAVLDSACAYPDNTLVLVAKRENALR